MSGLDASDLDRSVQAARRADERLARLLGPGPRHADARFGAGRVDLIGDADADAADSDDDGDAGRQQAADWLPDTPSTRSLDPPAAAIPDGSSAGLVRRIWEQRIGSWSFGPSQLAVIAVIVLLGLGLAGWSVLRARPVALGSGPPSGNPAAAGSTSQQSTPGPTASRSAMPTSPGPTSGSTSDIASRSASPDPTSSAAPKIKVHVLGAVKHPGVVELKPGARVQDALDRAGGPKKSADLGDLNLAQPVADGQQIFISRHGAQSEVRDPATAPPGGSPANPTGSADRSGAGGGSDSSTWPAGPVDLNAATVDELDQLPGVGPVTAEKIIDWRNQHGRFNSTEELQEVDGIGPKTYADLAPLVTV